MSFRLTYPVTYDSGYPLRVDFTHPHAHTHSLSPASPLVINPRTYRTALLPPIPALDSPGLIGTGAAGHSVAAVF